MECILFVCLALAAIVPQLLDLETFSVSSVDHFTSLGPVQHIVQYAACTPWKAGLTMLSQIQDGSTIHGGFSLTFHLFLRPFFHFMGVSTKAISVASIFGHLLFAAGLWWLVRSCLAGRSALAFALVFFASPWYRSVIFSNTYNGFSLITVIFSLVLFFIAVRKQRLTSFFWAGIALGVNFYGYAVGRTYPVLCVVFLAAWLALGTFKPTLSRTRKLLFAFVLIASILLPLGGNLTRPSENLQKLYFDPEMISGDVYREGINEKRMRLLEVGLTNLECFLRGKFLRFHDTSYDLVLLALFLIGAAASVLRKDPAGIAFTFFSVVIVLSGCFFVICWSHTRMGPVCLPILLTCALGLDALSKLVGSLLKKAWLRVPLKTIPLLLFALVAVAPNQFFLKYETEPASIFDVAKDLARWPEPLQVVLSTGGMGLQSDRLHAVLLTLLEANRTDEACTLEFLDDPAIKEIDDVFNRFGGSAALVVFASSLDITVPSVPLKLRREYPDKTAVYTVADAAGSGTAGTHE